MTSKFYPTEHHLPFVIEDYIEVLFDTEDGRAVTPLWQGTVEQCITRIVKHYVSCESVLRYYTALDMIDLVGDSIILFMNPAKEYAPSPSKGNFQSKITQKWNSWAYYSRGIVAHLWEPWDTVRKDILAEWLLHRIHILNRINYSLQHLDKILPSQIANSKRAEHFTVPLPKIAIAHDYYAWWTYRGPPLPLLEFAHKLANDFSEMHAAEEGSRDRERIGERIIGGMRYLLPTST